jgi:hypothetical protein
MRQKLRMLQKQQRSYLQLRAAWFRMILYCHPVLVLVFNMVAFFWCAGADV